MRRNIRKRKFWLKIISLIFAFFIWLYVVSTAEIEKDKNINLNYIVPNGYSLAEQYPSNVSITVRGPRLLVRKYLEKEESVDIEINSNYRRGKNRYLYNLQRMVGKPSFGLELLSIAPKNLEVDIERTVFKKVPIIVDLPESIADGFQVDSFKSTPKMVEISGAKSIVEKIGHVKTESLQDFDFTTGKNQEVGIVSPSNLISVATNTIVLSYTIDTEVSEFTFKKIPIIFQSGALIKSVSSRFVEVKISANEKSFSELEDKIQVIALIGSSTPRVQTIELNVSVPSGVELLEVAPKNIKIILE